MFLNCFTRNDKLKIKKKPYHLKIMTHNRFAHCTKIKNTNTILKILSRVTMLVTRHLCFRGQSHTQL